MKNTPVIYLLLILLTSCSAMPALAARGNEVIAQTPSPRPTATIQPTATMDIASTLSAAETARIDAISTADAANIVAAQITQEHEKIDLKNSQLTHESDLLTAQSDSWTATAALTMFPATGTAGAEDRKIAQDKITQVYKGMTATVEAPTIIVRIANARAEAETATARAWSDVFVRVVLSLSAFLMAVMMVILFFRRFDNSQSKTGAAQNIYEKPLADLKPIPMAPKPGSDTQTIRSEIPCTLPRLLLLAEGVVKNGKTLAKGQWEGTIVHRSLDELRKYFVGHGFAYELPGKKGELGILEKGVAFLNETLELGEPPAPHICREHTSPIQ